MRGIFAVRIHALVLALLVSTGCAGSALAQTPPKAPPEQEVACPPDVKGDPPTVGSGSSQPLGDKLAESKGVICPPAGVDQEMHVAPPESGGRLKVIPPPGTPGGDPSVQPK
jgi:hypothetical protein